MPNRYIRRQSSLAPGEDQRPNANTLYVDSDTNTIKVGTGNSGTTENELMDLGQAQTITGVKTYPSGTAFTAPLFTTSFVMVESTANLTVTSSDQTAAGTINFPDINAVGSGVPVASVFKHDASLHTAAGVTTGTTELAAASVILDIQMCSTVVWNSGTSDVMDIGDDQDADGWASQANLQAAGELILGEVFHIIGSGPTDAEGSGTLGFRGAFIANDGRKGQETATSSGTYNTQAHEVISVLTTVGTAPTTGTTFVTTLWVVPTETAPTFAAT